MASIEQYLMPDRNAEIAMARSAAPESISSDAKILVLGWRGYETAIEGKNGFVCMVERSWTSPFNSAQFWNPKVRVPVCFNPAAARSILPLTIKRTEMVLAGLVESSDDRQHQGRIRQERATGTGAGRDVLHDVAGRLP